MRGLNSYNMTGRCRDSITRRFNHDNIYYDQGKNVIWVVVYNQRGRRWIPFGGGPIYNESAINHCQWLVKHIEEYRELLPRRAREAKIMFGECYSENGQIFPMAPASV